MKKAIGSGRFVGRLIPKFVAVGLALSALTFTGLASAAGPCAGPSAGGDWPVFGHTTTADRYQDQEHLIAPENVGSLEAKWVLPAAGSFDSAPVVSNGCVYIATTGGDLYALNADSGDLAWQASVPSATTLSIANGRLFVQATTVVIAFDQFSGVELWRTDIAPSTYHGGGGSPLAFGDLVIAGVLCPDDTTASAEHPRGTCRGQYSILDQSTGDVLAAEWDTSDEDLARGMGGAGFWSQPSYDPETKLVYMGEANARSYAPENPNTSALLKIDADRTSPTFGKILGAFRTTSLGQNLGNTGPGDAMCKATNGNQLCTGDDDWVQAAIIYRDSHGRKLIGSGQSQSQLPLSLDWPIHGVYVSIDPVTFKEVWRTQTDGARAASGAYDGSRFYVAEGGNAWGGFGGRGGIKALNKDTGAVLWTAPTFGDNNWRHISAANGVVYTQSGGAVVGNPGTLLAYDAQTGKILLNRPMSLDVGAPATATTAGGVTIARNTVFSPTNTVGGGGYLIAYKLP